MKLLYLCFVEIVEISGISKKMLYQVKAFQKAGFDVKLCYEKIEKDKIYRKIYDTSITLEEVKNIPLFLYIFFQFYLYLHINLKYF